MTAELPLQQGGRCQDCREQIRLTRENRSLRVACDCSERSIKVETVLPAGWDV